MKIYILLKQPYKKSLDSDCFLVANIILIENRKDFINPSQWRVKAGQHSPQVSQGHLSIDFASGFTGSAGIPPYFPISNKVDSVNRVVKKQEDICGCYPFLLYSLFLVITLMTVLTSHTE